MSADGSWRPLLKVREEADGPGFLGPGLFFKGRKEGAHDRQKEMGFREGVPWGGARGRWSIF